MHFTYFSVICFILRTVVISIVKMAMYYECNKIDIVLIFHFFINHVKSCFLILCNPQRAWHLLRSNLQIKKKEYCLTQVLHCSINLSLPHFRKTST